MIELFLIWMFPNCHLFFHSWHICIYIYVNIFKGFLSITQIFELKLTCALTVLSGGRQLAQSPYFIFFSFMKNLAAPTDVPSSLSGCKAAIYMLWPEVVDSTVVRQVVRHFRECSTKSERAKIHRYLFVESAALLTGFFTLMAAAISFMVAVIEFY